jgi:hypothetical protein
MILSKIWIEALHLHIKPGPYYYSIGTVPRVYRTKTDHFSRFYDNATVKKD